MIQQVESNKQNILQALEVVANATLPLYQGEIEEINQRK